MTIEEFAMKLNGREMDHEITREEEKEAKALGFVVIFGAGDDNADLRGAIHDQIGCYDGGFIYFVKEGLAYNKCDNDDCPYFKRLREQHCKKVEAVWDSEGYSWTYKTDIPHATFDIMEDGEKFCRGIVFDIKELGEGVS